MHLSTEIWNLTYPISRDMYFQESQSSIWIKISMRQNLVKLQRHDEISKQFWVLALDLAPLG